MKLALGQLNFLIGDLKGNSQRILTACREGAQKEVDLLITPELSLWGYPPRDLLLDPVLLNYQWTILNEMAKTLEKDCPNLSLLVGVAEPTPDSQVPNLFNAIALVQSRGWKIIARKQLLPTYDVFDEKRYFRAATNTGILDINVNSKSWHIGVTICEDLWVEDKLQGQRVQGPDPLSELATKGIDLLINISASPFSVKKESLRQQLASKASKRLRCPVIYVNQVGGNDELVFDGASFAIDEGGEVSLALPRCKECIAIWEPGTTYKPSPSLPEAEEMLLSTLVLGVKDYAQKCGFRSVLIGLSGGIDSSLVAVIAAAALGADNVYGVLMPSPWSSDNSLKDALDLAKRLGIQTNTIPISSLMSTFDTALKEVFVESPKDITAENLQARIRGTLLMAIANQKKHLLLSTGNKSELAVGYCTLYGDMNGGVSVIGDLYKTSVFNLCTWLDSKAAENCKESLGLPKQQELIGTSIRTKPPSAELRPGQLDSDSLPEYKILDPILKALIEDRTNPVELIKNGCDSKLVQRVQLLLKQSEFKRRQAPPVFKVSNQAFGSGWRLPIAASYSRLLHNESNI